MWRATGRGCWGRDVGSAVAGDAASHDGDHGPVEVGLVAFGQAFVVADAPPVFHNPSRCAPDHPAAGQHLESVQVVGPLDDLHGAAGRPGDQLAGVSAVAQIRLTCRNPAASRHSRWRAASRSCTEAAVTTITRDEAEGIGGDVLFAALDFLPGVMPPAGLADGVAPLADWESMTAAVGLMLRPVSSRACPRSSSCILLVAPLACYART